MTDTNSKPEEGDVKIPTKEELLDSKEPENTNDAEGTPEYDPEEDIARQSGWVPQTEWKGRKEDWRPAKEFNERGELFSRIKSQSKELAEVKKAMDMLVNQQSKQYLKGFEDALTQLKNQRTAAIAEGDLEKVVQITDKIDEVKEKRQEAERVAQPKGPQGPSETFKEWHGKNSWYLNDKQMSEYAEDVGEIYKKRNPTSSEMEMLEHVARQVRKEYPNKFKKAPPSPDGEGKHSSGGGRQSNSGSSEIESNMNEQELSIMRTIIKQTGMTKQDYLRQYAEAR